MFFRQVLQRSNSEGSDSSKGDSGMEIRNNSSVFNKVVDTRNQSGGNASDGPGFEAAL
jgi:hypothetical protein